MCFGVFLLCLACANGRAGYAACLCPARLLVLLLRQPIRSCFPFWHSFGASQMNLFALMSFGRAFVLFCLGHNVYTKGQSVTE